MPFRPSVLAGLAILLFCTPAQAYFGPGAGISAIGTVLALLAGLALAVIGFFWYPLKRFFRRSGKAAAPPGDTDAADRDPR